MFAGLLARKGAKVFLLLDPDHLIHRNNKILRQVAEVNEPSKKKKYVFRRWTLSLVNQRLKPIGIRIMYYKNYLKNKPELIPNSKEDWKHIKSHLIKIIQNDDPEVVVSSKYSQLKEILTKNAQISRTVAVEILNDLNVDLLVTSHGIYSYYGPFRSAFVERKIDCIVYGHGLLNGGVLMLRNILNTFSMSEEYEEYKRDTKFNRAIDEFATKVIESRLNKTFVDTSIYYQDVDYGTHFEGVNEKLEFKHTIAFFPNVVEDGNVIQRNHIFDGIVSWIFKTIEIARINPRNRYIIRMHPSEETVFKILNGFMTYY